MVRLMSAMLMAVLTAWNMQAAGGVVASQAYDAGGRGRTGGCTTVRSYFGDNQTVTNYHGRNN